MRRHEVVSSRKRVTAQVWLGQWPALKRMLACPIPPSETHTHKKNTHTHTISCCPITKQIIAGKLLKGEREIKIQQPSCWIFWGNLFKPPPAWLFYPCSWDSDPSGHTSGHAPPTGRPPRATEPKQELLFGLIKDNPSSSTSSSRGGSLLQI